MKFNNSIFAVMILATGLIAAVEAPVKVPSDIAVRIRNVQLDQTRTQAQMIQLQSQYQSMQNQVAHDNGEIESLKKEALVTAKLDDGKHDVDVEKLEFITKPEPVKEPKK